MRLFHRPRRIVAVVATVFVGTTLTTISFSSPSANAATVYGCPDDYICLYRYKDFKTKIWSKKIGATPNGCITFKGGPEDLTSSVIWNRKSETRKALLFQGRECLWSTKAPKWIGPAPAYNWRYSNLKTQSQIDNSISSIGFYYF